MKNELNTLRSLYVKKRIEEIQTKVFTAADKSPQSKVQYSEEKITEIDKRLLNKKSKKLSQRYTKQKINEIQNKVKLNEISGLSGSKKLVDQTPVDQAYIQKITAGTDVIESIFKAQGFIPKARSASAAILKASQLMNQLIGKSSLTDEESEQLSSVGTFLDVLLVSLKTSLPNIRKILSRTIDEPEWAALQEKATNEHENVKALLKITPQDTLLTKLSDKIKTLFKTTTKTSDETEDTTEAPKEGETEAPKKGETEAPKEDEFILKKESIEQIQYSFNTFSKTLQTQSEKKGGLISWLLGDSGDEKFSMIVPDHEEFAKDLFVHALSTEYGEKMSIGVSGAARVSSALETAGAAARKKAGSEDKSERSTKPETISTLIDDIEKDKIDDEEFKLIAKALLDFRKRKEKES